MLTPRPLVDVLGVSLAVALMLHFRVVALGLRVNAEAWEVNVRGWELIALLNEVVLELEDDGDLMIKRELLPRNGPHHFAELGTLSCLLEESTQMAYVAAQSCYSTTSKGRRGSCRSLWTQASHICSAAMFCRRSS